MIDVVEVAPERALLDATSHAEVGLRSGRCAGNPTTTRRKVVAGLVGDEAIGFVSAADSRGRGAEDNVHAGAR